MLVRHEAGIKISRNQWVLALCFIIFTSLSGDSAKAVPNWYGKPSHHRKSARESLLRTGKSGALNTNARPDEVPLSNLYTINHNHPSSACASFVRTTSHPIAGPQIRARSS